MSRYDDPAVRSRAVLAAVGLDAVEAAVDLAAGLVDGKAVHESLTRLCRDFAGHDATLAGTEQLLAQARLAIDELAKGVATVTGCMAMAPELLLCARAAAAVSAQSAPDAPARK